MVGDGIWHERCVGAASFSKWSCGSLGWDGDRDQLSFTIFGRTFEMQTNHLILDHGFHAGMWLLRGQIVSGLVY